MVTNTFPAIVDCLNGHDTIAGNPKIRVARATQENYTVKILSDASILCFKKTLIDSFLNIRKGNKCGHDRQSPIFFSKPISHAARPKLLQEAMERLSQAYNNKKFLKNLHFLTPKPRKKRSERMEAIIAVSQALVHYVDAWSLRVGLVTGQGEFQSFDLKFIASRAKLNIIRTRRALYDLCKAGYLKITRQYQKQDDDTYSGIASIRELTTDFFNDLGIDYHRLFQLQEWKRKRQEKAQLKAKKKHSLFALMRGITTTLNRKKPKPPRVFESELAAKAHIERMRWILAESLRIHTLYPERCLLEISKELKNQRHNE
jgi:hypothetical protein